MESLSSRLKSFSKSKSSKSSKTNSLGWPHPDSFAANPNTLADAGFYFSPSADDPDNVVCFMCEKELGGWEEDDNPFDIHVDKCPKCPWALARCSLEHDCDSKGDFAFKDASRLPSNKVLEKARLDTFGGKRKWWPHDANKTHGATSKKLSKAGFIYTPQESGVHDDTATCFYCDLSLSGWDPEDDPIMEHKKREERSGKRCPFFSADVSKPSTSKPNGTRKSKATVSNKVATPDATVLLLSGKDNAASSSQTTFVASTKQTKQRAPAKSKAKPGESSEHEKPLPKKPSQPKRSEKQPPTAEEDDEGDVMQSRSTKQHKMHEVAKMTAKKGKEVDMSHGGSDESQEGDNRRGRPETKSASRRPQTNVDEKNVKEYEDYVVPLEAEDVDSRKAKPASTRARSKSKSHTDGERSTSRASTKSHTRSRSKTTVVTDDEPGEIMTESGSSKLRKSTRTTKKAAPPSKAGSSKRNATDAAKEPVSTRPSSPEPVASSVGMQVDEQPLERSIEQTANGTSKARKPISGQRKSPMEDRSNTSHLTDSVQPPVAQKSAHLVPMHSSTTSDKIATPEVPSTAHVSGESLFGRPGIARPAAVVVSDTGEQPEEQGRLTGRNDMDVDDDVIVDLPKTPPRQPIASTPPQTAVHWQPPTIVPTQNTTGSLDLPTPFLPALAESPMKYTTELSEAERAMTVEEYIRYEMTRELEHLRLDGQRTIETFRAHAAEVRARIEAL